MSEKKKYVVKAGQTFGVDSKPAGSIVELTEAEARPFADKLDPYEEKKASKEPVAGKK